MVIFKAKLRNKVSYIIPCQLTPFSPFPILLKFGMFVELGKKMSQTKFQVSRSKSFRNMKVEKCSQYCHPKAPDRAKVALLPYLLFKFRNIDIIEKLFLAAFQ